MRVHGPVRSHQQAIALGIADADVRAAFRQQDVTDHLAIRREHGDAVLPFAAGEAAPDVALHVAADVLCVAGGRIEKQAAVAQRPAVLHDVADARRRRTDGVVTT
jgi:hypothetical protein